MKSQSKVLFRMDAGPHIGLGHLQRCLSLAIALKEVGVPSLFLANENESSRQRAEKFGFPIATFTEPESWDAENAETTIKVALQDGCNIVLVDSHEVRADYLAQIRAAGIYVIARDDLAEYSFPCQMVVNGNADACELSYSSSSGDTLFLRGPKYAVLGQEYWEAPERVVPKEVANVLVIVGGSDPFNLVPTILSLLDRSPGEFTVTAVIGPYFQNVAEVEAVAERIGRSVKLARSPETVHDLMIEADLAISAGGQALYELARVGCPTVAIRLADNQGGQLKAMAHSGCLLPAGDAEQGDVTADVTDAFGCLLSSAEQRASMAVLGQELIDGTGALRLAREISAV
jgi:UDP-2,4-diacetamido-2,4,6-trideoxy-beta-L-altropyranose hydrolase